MAAEAGNCYGSVEFDFIRGQATKRNVAEVVEV